MLYKSRTLRHECKYIINAGVYELLAQRLKAAMTLDANSVGDGYRITSVYFDNVYRSAYNDKLAGDRQRRKFRIRAYNLSDKRISLECKYKDDQCVSKRSAQLTREQYDLMLRGEYEFGRSEYFWDTTMEDFMTSDSLTALKPHVLVDYFREAYTCPAGNVRITFDKRLSTCLETADMFRQGAVFTPVIGDNIILEVKYDDFIPDYIQQIINGFPLIEESVSKYVLCSDKAYEYNHYHLSQV